MYKAQAEGQAQGAPDPAASNAAGDTGQLRDDVQDVDFEEVK